MVITAQRGIAPRSASVAGAAARHRDPRRTGTHGRCTAPLARACWRAPLLLCCDAARVARSCAPAHLRFDTLPLRGVRPRRPMFTLRVDDPLYGTQGHAANPHNTAAQRRAHCPSNKYLLSFPLPNQPLNSPLARTNFLPQDQRALILPCVYFLPLHLNRAEEVVLRRFRAEVAHQLSFQR